MFNELEEEHKHFSCSSSRLMEEQKKTQVAENQYYIETLAEILVLTATENIAQQWSQGVSRLRKKGVFLSMLDLMGNHNPIN